VIAYLLVLAVTGLIVGALGRLALPGPDPMGLMATAGIGIAGSFMAGLLSWALWGRAYGNIILSVAFATAIVYLIRRSRGGSLTRPGTPPPDRRR
jgi:uncharacterized membrane protein YeaQ/YmgE (transglycosylase-associated protein family)